MKLFKEDKFNFNRLLFYIIIFIFNHQNAKSIAKKKWRHERVP